MWRIFLRKQYYAEENVNPFPLCNRNTTFCHPVYKTHPIAPRLIAEMLQIRNLHHTQIHLTWTGYEDQYRRIGRPSPAIILMDFCDRLGRERYIRSGMICRLVTCNLSFYTASFRQDSCMRSTWRVITFIFPTILCTGNMDNAHKERWNKLREWSNPPTTEGTIRTPSRTEAMVPWLSVSWKRKTSDNRKLTTNVFS